MTKGQRFDRQTGCFAWIIRAKQSVNERWAKARNRFRKCFNRDNNKPNTADELLNDTGTPDMVITKVPMVPKHNGRATPPEQAVEDTSNANDQPGVQSIPTRSDIKTVNGKFIDRDGNGDPDYNQVRLFVLDLIDKARLKYDVLAEAPTPPSQVDTCTKIVVQEDTLSLSSSVISAPAEVAVSESLSKIVMEQNGNQSARTGIAAPRTVSEVLEYFNIDPSTGTIAPPSSGLPPTPTYRSTYIRRSRFVQVACQCSEWYLTMGPAMCLLTAAFFYFQMLTLNTVPRSCDRRVILELTTF